MGGVKALVQLQVQGRLLQFQGRLGGWGVAAVRGAPAATSAPTCASLPASRCCFLYQAPQPAPPRQVLHLLANPPPERPAGGDAMEEEEEEEGRTAVPLERQVVAQVVDALFDRWGWVEQQSDWFCHCEPWPGGGAGGGCPVSTGGLGVGQ